MEQNQLLAFVMMMMLVLSLGGWRRCHGCLEHERDALLQIKASFGYPTSLLSWGIDADCCKWPLVNCNNSTGQVIGLSPRRDYDNADFYLNTSLFLPFKELERLDLSGNNILDFVESEDLERLAELDNLTILDLSMNRLNNNILSFLGSLSSLKELDLSFNTLSGSVNASLFLPLKELECLNLSGNIFDSMETEGLERLVELDNLKILELSFNGFNNGILSSLGALTSLKKLSLNDNRLNGSINIHELNNLKNLEVLDLSDNQIQAFKSYDDDEDIPRLVNLKSLDLGYNLFRNDILLFIKRFPTLTHLGIRNNSLQGVLNMAAFRGLSNLKKLDLGGNDINEIVAYKESSFNVLEELSLDGSSVNEKSLESLGDALPSLKLLSLAELKGTTVHIQGICNLKRLQELDLRNNNLNGTLPMCLANLTSLQVLDISSNHFVGDISSSPLISLTNIQRLVLSQNHFRIPGSLSPFHNHSKFKELEFGDSEIYAETEVPDLAPKFQLQNLYVSGYGYNGSFPKFLYHQHDLQSCVWSGLGMRGEFPKWLIDNNTKLETLDLSNNLLSGPLQLPGKSNLKLWYLGISDNRFHSHIPAEIGSYFPGLNYLSLSGNILSGSIPSSFGNMSFLMMLVLDGNELTGSIPNSMSNCSSLVVFSAKDNHLSGNLSTGFIPSRMQHLHLSNNKLQGSLENAFPYHLREIQLLDLSHNSFTGGIPERIGGFAELRYLSLSYNNLEGKIPIQLCKLKSLNTLDVSHNNLYGSIPPCLGADNEEYLSGSTGWQKVGITTKGMSFVYSLGVVFLLFDFSCNNFTGNIPPEFGKFNYVVSMNFSHNHLTGPIPPTFANLTQIESLDLSYNNLDGVIPPQLVALTFLSAFSVAHNNLSGRTPPPVAQFGTFEKRCYEGNPFLCGWPLSNCSTDRSSSPVPTTSTKENKESGFTETEAFWVSFGVAYIMVLLTTAAVLYINPYWRRAWLYYVELWMTDCYYFVLDNVSVLLSKFRF